METIPAFQISNFSLENRDGHTLANTGQPVTIGQ
ncbi:hypothetical protein B0G77_2694 [Paraburkholderia sp. BL10I2N1]|nr:hypothetical protein B0G77_2694 [Paraburkholderia sp. BL10I2N1]